ncbi:globin family protein [Ideonella sp. YS5]|uniref:globin family protein n=1 Tax=Ideonella sp. YS5 TaxID=3453714 RepID=UPI003EEBF123
MNAQQVRLVRESFALVQPIASQAAALFYDNLFDSDPSLRGMFRGDMVAQGERLMSMIGAAVGLLERPDALVPVLRNLGGRHVGYGVRDHHYATVGAALIETLEQGLGDAFTPEVREAWVTLYGVVSRTMMEGSLETADAI